MTPLSPNIHTASKRELLEDVRARCETALARAQGVIRFGDGLGRLTNTEQKQIEWARNGCAAYAEMIAGIDAQLAELPD